MESFDFALKRKELAPWWKKKVGLALTIGLALCLLPGCAKKEAKKEQVIGVSLLTLQDDFYIMLKKGLAKRAEKQGIKVIFTNADFNLSRQKEDIENFIQQKIDLLLLSPVSSSEIGLVISRVNKEGIPVVTFDIRAETGEVKTHIASDDKGAGKACARYVGELLGGKGQVAVITHFGITSCSDRVKAFETELKSYPNLEIVSIQNAESRREKAKSCMEKVLAAHPDVDCVVGANDLMTFGAMEAIQEAGRTDDIKAVMVSGGQKETFERLKADDPCLKAAALVFPYLMGLKTIDAAMDVLNAEPLPSQILVPVRIITHKNAAEVQRIWGKVKVIGASLLTLQDDFYVMLNKGLRDEAERHYIKLISRNADFRLSKQIADIEDFVQQKVDLLIVSPVSPAAIGPSIDEASRKGIPVVTVDIRLETGKVESHIASDDIGAGRECARYIAKLLKGKGEIGIITHPVVTSCLDRVRGLREELRNYPGVKIISEQNAESRREKAISCMEDILTAHPEVDCIIGMNDVMTLGGIAAIEGANRIKDIKAVMVSGGQKETFDRLRANDPCLKAAALVFPYSIGRKALQTAVKIFEGQLVSSEILVPVRMVTHENVSEMEAMWGGTK